MVGFKYEENMDRYSTPERELEAKSEYRLLYDFLKRLKTIGMSRVERRVLASRLFYGYSFRGMVELDGFTSVGTAYNMYNRALIKLKRLGSKK